MNLSSIKSKSFISSLWILSTLISAAIQVTPSQSNSILYFEVDSKNSTDFTLSFHFKIKLDPKLTRNKLTIENMVYPLQISSYKNNPNQLHANARFALHESIKKEDFLQMKETVSIVFQHTEFEFRRVSEPDSSKAVYCLTLNSNSNYE